jgi:superfamily II DNA helicase RecQ
MTPEKVAQSPATYDMLRSLSDRALLDRFVIDESHCVSEWGKDFRPQYLNLNCLRKDFPCVPIMALTATASSSVREDVVQKLQMRDPEVFQCSFNRPNLVFEVKEKQDPKITLKETAGFLITINL